MNRVVFSPCLEKRLALRVASVCRHGVRPSNPYYVNCLLNDIRRLSTVSRAGWSYSQLATVRREINHLNGLIQRSSVALVNGQKRLYSDEKNDKDKNNKQEDVVKAMFKLFQIGFVLSITILIGTSYFVMDNMQEIKNWDEFERDFLSKGLVQRVVISTNPDDHSKENIYIYVRPEARYSRSSVNTQKPFFWSCPKGSFEKRVQEFEKRNGIIASDKLPITYRPPLKSTDMLLTLIAVGAVVGAIMMLANKRMPQVGKSGKPKDSQQSMSDMMNDMIREPVKLKMKRGDQMVKGMTFKDVAGLHEAKVEIMEFVDYIKSPGRYKALGATVPKGALLLGPPGCGKTLLAKALAAEANVPFFAQAGTDFVEMIGGLGASRVRDLFKSARENKPCIIYIDEIDAIGSQRSKGSQMSNSEEEQTLNQLLVEMDGMGTIEGVLILGSTNRADVLDKALLRPGRFDRHILIDKPTVTERVELFEIYLSKLTLEKAISAYAVKLAQRTPGMTGADIANVCNEAAIKAARDQKKFVASADFDYAIERVVAGSAKANSQTAGEKNITAYHESGHALIEWLSASKQKLLKVSIVPRTSSQLGFSQYTESDQYLKSREELFDRMCSLLAGRVAESLVFNKVTTGAEDDLKKVTNIAEQMVSNFGMNKMVGHLSFPTEDEMQRGMSARPYSKHLRTVMDDEKRKLVADAYKHTEKIMSNNMDKLHKLADALLEKESLEYLDIERLIGPPPHQKYKESNDPTEFFA